MTQVTATPTYSCTECGRDVPRGLATIRTTLRNGVPSPVAWCRTCRPVLIPQQRTAVTR